jgi:hypothetical protein
MKIKSIRTAAILGIFFVLAIASLQAQTPGRVEVNVPFDFAAGKATLKAGTYSLKKANGNAIVIRSLDGKASSVVNSPLVIGSRAAKPGARLVFNKYGDQYFLSQIWTSSDAGRQLFPTNAEQNVSRQYQLAHNGAKAERIEVALR